MTWGSGELRRKRCFRALLWQKRVVLFPPEFIVLEGAAWWRGLEATGP